MELTEQKVSCDQTQECMKTQGVTEKEFTTEMLYEVVTRTLADSYYDWPAVRAMYQLEDLVQNTMLWYYQPMRNGEIRIKHYMKEAPSVGWLISLVRLSCKQTIPEMMRLNAHKYFPSSLNVPMKDDTETEFIDLLASSDDSPEQQVIMETFIESIKTQLNERQNNLLNRVLNGEVEFKITLCSDTNGYSKEENSDMGVIRRVAKQIYESNGELLSEIFRERPTRKSSMSR